jgi:hypothetical protein
MDALPVVEAHPARLERVLRIAGRDGPAGEIPRPCAVGHVPWRVDDLLLDLVAAGGRLEAGPAYRDLVAVHEAQMLVQAQFLGAAVDRDDRRVALGEVGERAVGPRGDRDRDLDGASAGRRGHPLHERRDELRPLDVDAVARVLAQQLAVADVDVGVLRGTVDALGHAVDEGLHGTARVGDPRRHRGVHVAAAEHAAEGVAAVAPLATRVRDRTVDVEARPRQLRPQHEPLGAVADRHRPANGARQLALQPRTGLAGIEPADVHLADADAVGDAVVARTVDHEHRGDEHHHERHEHRADHHRQSAHPAS